MALLTSEIERIRDELGYNVLGVGAEPYISYVAVFDQVIAIYLEAGATTTSATAVTAATPPALVSITVASATGFHAGDRAVVDVDASREEATLTVVSGSVLTLSLSKAHSGTYPVTVFGGETIVRDKLDAIAEVKARMRTGMLSTAGLKRADEVEWYPGRNGRSAVMASLKEALGFWRDELASSLGVQNLWRLKPFNRGAGVALY